MLALASTSIVAGSLGITRADALRSAAAGAVFSFSPSTATAASAAPSVGSSAAVLYDTRSGLFMEANPLKYLSAALAANEGAMPRVFFAGEEHTHKLHHTVQLEMIKAVAALDDAPTLIGLEMCWRQHQPALDAFVFGDEAQGGGDLEKLAQRTRWSVTWGYPIELYADVLAFARAERLRLCGLNTPYPVVQAVSKEGLDALRPELRQVTPPIPLDAIRFHLDSFCPDLRQLLPRVDLTNLEHRRRFAEAMGGSLDADNALVPPVGEGAHGPMTAPELQRMCVERGDEGCAAPGLCSWPALWPLLVAALLREKRRWAPLA